VEKGEALPEPIRQDLLAMHAEVYARAEAFDAEAAKVPGNMIARTRALGLTLPFKELVTGYDASLEGRLETRQFAGTLEAQADGLAAGRPFTLRIRMVNAGVCPWIPGVGHLLELGGDAARLGLPLHWDYESPSMVFGDRREIELRGMAPAEAGKAMIRLSFLAPFRNAHAFLRKDVELQWK
jgi:hypothetical protein